MSVRLYDEALSDKLNKWVKGTGFRVLKPNETTDMFQMQADLNNDKPITLPLIALSRDTKITILNTFKQPKTYDGFKINAYDNNGNLIENGKVLKLCVIPIQLEYQLDIYCAKIDQADDYLREFIFNLINYPNLEVEIPYNDCKLRHESTIFVDNDVEDNSDIPQRLFPKQFTRYTIKLTIDNAYLFSASIKENILIHNINMSLTNQDGSVETVNVYNEEKK